MICQRALIIAPHHDDEIIGCGGTILHLVANKCAVGVVHVFCGSSGIGPIDPDISSKQRTAEAKRAAVIGGYELLPHLGFLDRQNTTDSDVVHSLIRSFRKFQPDLILTPHDNEQDYEHQIVARCSWEASWLASANIFPELGKPSPKITRYLGYEVWRPIDTVATYLDITPFIDKKIELLSQFNSQVANTDWLQAARGLSSYRGTTLLGQGYCEAFTLRNINANLIL